MQDLRRIIWLASYPKSGNTWMRSLLAHYFMPDGMAPNINNLNQFTTGDVRKDFYDKALGRPYEGKTIEEWMAVRPIALRLIAASKPNHHFVKTHCQPIKLCEKDVIPPELTAAAIYIIRNPFDLTPSFARHQNCDIDLAIERMSFKDIFVSSDKGIHEILGRWDDHVTSWTNAPGLPMHIIRYEDMLEDIEKVIIQLLEKFLRIQVDRKKLASAIEATSFDAMKVQEETLGFSEKPTGMERFFAKGRAGVWREDLTPAQVAKIRKEFLPVIEKWYPEMLKETEEFAKSADKV